MNDLKFISAFGETLEISFHKDFNRKKKEIQQTDFGPDGGVSVKSKWKSFH